MAKPKFAGIEGDLRLHLESVGDVPLDLFSRVQIQDIEVAEVLTGAVRETHVQLQRPMRGAWTHEGTGISMAARDIDIEQVGIFTNALLDNEVSASLIRLPDGRPNVFVSGFTDRVQNVFLALEEES